MNPNEITIKNFLIAGISTITSNKNEENFATAKIPLLWSDFIHKNVFENIPLKNEKSKIIAAYTNYKSDHNDEYSLIIGTEVLDKKGSEKFDYHIIEASKYLSFKIQGKFPEAVISGWKEVWSYFANNKEIQRAYTTDFEEYISENELNINIAIK